MCKAAESFRFRRGPVKLSVFPHINSAAGSNARQAGTFAPRKHHGRERAHVCLRLMRVRAKGWNEAMTYLRGTTYREQTVAQPLSNWTPADLRIQRPGKTAWISGFARALAQTASPSAVWEFFRELNTTDPLLSRLGWALLAVIPIFAALAFFTPAAHGANPWIKPIKFSLSFSTFVTTISLFLLALRLPAWQLRWARRVIAGSVALEIFSLGAQAWRAAHVASPGFADSVLSQLTNSMVMVNTAMVAWMMALLCARRVRTEVVDRPMLLALRSSIVIFLAGNAIGGYMLARGSHTVGAPDGGPGLPFLNWSTIAGDLRIAHFIALHAIQIVPLFAYVLSQMAAVPALKQRRLAVAALATMVSLAVGATFVQAALGRPVIP
jgi:hypothetical protein